MSWKQTLKGLKRRCPVCGKGLSIALGRARYHPACKKKLEALNIKK